MENKKRILVCDDDEGVRESLNLILEDRYEVVLSVNGEDCCRRLEAGENYDILLLDIKMPRISGLDILKKVKEKKPSQKAIIITGYGCADVAAEAINMGACDYIVKPFNSKDVLNSVAKNI